MVHDSRKPTQPFSAAVGQPWASNLIEAQHEESLYAFGELTLYTMMWLPQDNLEGRVDHCSVCYVGVDARRAAAFDQPIRRKCPNCFGTTFEGGYRAQIIRPTIWGDRDVQIDDERRAFVSSDTLQIETTSDFTLNSGDYGFRFDNARYQMDQKGEHVLRTGFTPPLTSDSFTGAITAHLEDPTTVAHMIPPEADELLDMLGIPGPFTVGDITATDIVRPGGYLI